MIGAGTLTNGGLVLRACHAVYVVHEAVDVGISTLSVKGHAPEPRRTAQRPLTIPTSPAVARGASS